MAQAREALTKSVNLILPYDDIDDEMLNALKELCERHRGDCELRLCVQQREDGKDTVVRARSLRVDPCDELLNGVDEIIGPRRWRLEPDRQFSFAVAAPEERRFAARS